MVTIPFLGGKIMNDPLNILHTVGFDVLYPIVRAGISLQAPLDHERLQHAVVKVHHVIPQLTQPYQLAGNQFVDAGFGVDDVLHFVDEIDESAAAKLDWETQPQWQLYAAPNELIIYGSHILSDGAGFKELLYLLCQAYNQDGPLEESNHQDIDGIRKLIAKIPAGQSQQNDHPAAPLSLPAIKNDHEQPAYHVFSQSLTVEESAKLHQHTKAAGLTLNDAFLAAFGKAVQQFCGVDEISLACPTDMRQFLPAEQQSQLRVQNLTGRYNITVKAPLTESIQDTTAKVHDAMDDEKKRHSFLNSFRSLLGQLDAGASLDKLQQQVENNYHVRDIAYTNMAVVDDQRLQFMGSPISNCILTGGFRQMPRYQICVSTFRHQFNLAANVIATPTEKQLAWAVMTTMRLYLLNL